MMSSNTYAARSGHRTGQSNIRQKDRVRWMALTGVLMGMNVAMCAFSIPVPGGHLYLNDVVICTAALLMDEPAAFLVGGVGAMIGDMLFYPVAMFVSLFAHGLQAVAVSLIYHKLISTESGARNKKAAAVAAALVGAVIMVTGYTLGKIYVYSTFEYAMIKLPYEIAQALLGVAGSVALCFRGKLMEYFARMDF